jgi:histidine phosphotransfer protein HptB
MTVPSATSNGVRSTVLSTAPLNQSKLAIDWVQLYQLSDGNQEFEVELIKLFFVESKTLLTHLSNAILRQDCLQVEHLAHQLKGSSGNLGFRVMSSIAGKLELQAKYRNLEFATEQVQELMQWILEIQKFLE